MAIIVEHVETQTLYVLVGSGYALGSKSSDDAYPLVACADDEGKIRWFYSNQLSVELVDGRRPDDLLVEAEGIVYDRGAVAAPPPTAPVEELRKARARVDESKARADDAVTAAETATPIIEEPPVDPKQVVGTSAELWNDPRPL